MTSHGKDNLYKVDSNGQVWIMPVGGKSSSNAQPWTALPNPTKIDLKRLSTRNENVLWGVSSDHQVYVYILKPDIPIRVKIETFENQRWFPGDGFSQKLLPTDRAKFSSEDGTKERTKDSIKLPSDAWVWEGEWQIDTMLDEQVLDREGWTYAVDFPATYHSEKSWKSCVRRRKWFRIRRFIGFNRWQKIEPIHEDFTQEPFTDICAGAFSMASPEISSVWAITVLGHVYFRTNVTVNNPEGSLWQQVVIKKGFEACQVTVSSFGVPFIVSWTGNFLYRVGVTAQNPIGTGWIEANGPKDNGLLQLSAGTSTLWGITRAKYLCWATKGDLQENIHKMVTCFEWSQIPKTLKAISVGKCDQVVLGLGDDDEIYVRFGITKDQQHGQGWSRVFPDDSNWDTVSTTSSDAASADQTDDGNTSSGESSSSMSLISIKPEYPKYHAISEQAIMRNKKGVCWVDGGCLSALKYTGPENDLEVGPWRDDILNKIQSLRVKGEEFVYPEALEKTDIVWSKSTAACIIQHGIDSNFAKGQLEILNNDTIVFHKNMNHRWICSIKDILGVLLTYELVFTLRVRNAIEVGVADFVSFKFNTEKDFEECYQVLNELSTKSSEDMTMTGAWLTTLQGEILDCGCAKISDSPLEGEVITPSNTDARTHYPLIKGFLPGSIIRLDISIPINAKSFSINLEGRTYVALHFNPRFNQGLVVRNTMSHGTWGEEETDGVFPFLPGHSYLITIECTDTHVITTASVERKKFIFTFRHRVAPKYITSFNAGGDLNVLGIRYDPKTGNGSTQSEFVTKPVPGHFWKVETSRSGFVWAVSFDFNVWVYTLSSKDQKKFESDSYNTVTDDEIHYIYENERWNPLFGFGKIGLPTDRSMWSDESGRIPLEKDTIKLRTHKWRWVLDWEIDYSVKSGADEDGWQYAIDFPAAYHSSKHFNDFVRRRCWKRLARHSVEGPWQLIPGVKLVDFSLHMNDDCEWEVLGATKEGDAVVRRGITSKNPIGTHWEQISGPKPFISVSSWFGHRYWAVSKDGNAWIRYSNNWQMLDKPAESQLKLIRVGPNGDVWGIDRKHTLFRRTDITFPALPEGRDWCEACKGVVNISFGPDNSLYALLKTKGVFPYTLVKRAGILQDSPSGIGWETIAEGNWSHISMCGVRHKSS